MVEKETKQLAEDTWNILDSIISSANLVSFSQGNHKDFDAYMLGIETAKKCKTTTLKDQAINDIIERFHHLYVKCDEHGGMKIIRGKRKEYEHLCTGIDHKYIEELKDYIQNAVEVEDEA